MAVSLGWEPEGRRRPGRPKQTWRRVVLKKLKTTGIRSTNEAAELAKDSERCKQKALSKLSQVSQKSLIPENMYLETHVKPVRLNILYLICLIFTVGLQLLPL